LIALIILSWLGRCSPNLLAWILAVLGLLAMLVAVSLVFPASE